jgi:uncharacterized membrane protein
MSWSNNFTVTDRAFASLVYLFPMLSALDQFFRIPGFLQVIYGFSPLVIVILLYFFVLKNPKISRLIRFNALQAMLLGTVLSLCRIIIGSLLLPVLGPVGLMLLIVAAVAIGVACVYSVIMTVQGKYAEIPELSKNTNLWVDSI